LRLNQKKRGGKKRNGGYRKTDPPKKKVQAKKREKVYTKEGGGGWRGVLNAKLASPGEGFQRKKHKTGNHILKPCQEKKENYR